MGVAEHAKEADKQSAQACKAEWKRNEGENKTCAVGRKQNITKLLTKGRPWLLASDQTVNEIILGSVNQF